MTEATILDYVGKTPIVKLQRIVPENSADVYVKLEQFNAGGSVKDRIALALIEDAEKSGILKQGSIIIEPTSGNTGIGLAWIGAIKGYEVVIVLPESVSNERKQLIKAYGATLIQTAAADGIKGSIKVVEEYLAKDARYVNLNQFENPANPQVHYDQTGPEIVSFFKGVPDVFIAGAGTGGTISGAGKYLREQGDLKIVVVEPAGSSVLSTGKAGKHKIQGIGAGIIPGTLDREIYDDIAVISDDEARNTARLVAVQEGILLGYSSGAAIAAALQEAEKVGAGHKVLALAPDTGERYLSTDLYALED